MCLISEVFILSMMLLYLFLSFLLSLFYSYVIFSALREWKHLPEWTIPVNFQPATFITILIPARNEAANIAACLQSILNQNYPKELFELIVINDHSTDSTADIILSLQSLHPNIILLHLADFINGVPINAYKKKALASGIAHAKGELIVTTDADCIVQRNWLLLLASFYETKRPKCIAAPVNFHNEKNLLERFQSLDYAGTMVLTGAGIRARAFRLSNGANLAFSKAVFEEVQGYESINQIASGDDMLLVHKIAARYPDGIAFLKNPAATVFTEAKPTWREFWQQRIRWATKSTAYSEWRITLVVAMVFFYCCNILGSLLFIPFFGLPMAGIFMIQLLFKLYWDYQLLHTACQYFKKEALLKSFLPAQLLHIGYMVVIGVLGNVVREYRWKDRKVR